MRSDRKAIIIVITLIILYLLVWIMGSVINGLFYFFPLLNLLTGLSVLIYWVQKQIRIKQHIFERREIIVLCLEIIVVAASAYQVKTGPVYNWLTIMAYLFFGVHLLALVIGLIFLLTFKIKKLI